MYAPRAFLPERILAVECEGITWIGQASGEGIALFSMRIEFWRSTATWLVRQVERDAMFAEKPPGTTQPSTYSALRDSKTLILKTDEHDVFGDGTVVIKSAPGHTPGHQVLYLKLAKTGGVLLSGDLYHYPEERVLDRVPTFDFNQEQTRATRVAIDGFLKKTGAQLWIQHDFNATARLQKLPRFYE